MPRDLKALTLDVIYDAELWREMRAAMLPDIDRLFLDAYILGAELGAMQEPVDEDDTEVKAIDILWATVLKQLDPRDETILPFDWEGINSASAEVIATYSDDWWAQFEQSTQRQMRAIFDRAERLGLTTADVTRELTPLFGAQRARLIAESELTNLLGMGAQETYRRAGFARWEWRTVRDARVDPDCEIKHKRRYPMSVPFRREHPRCRCVVEGTLVSASGLLSAMRRRYEGPVVTIRTALGHELTVTPNHPIATPAGWLLAAQLREGQDVLSDDQWVEVGGLVDPHDVQRPARIEDVWDAVAQSPYSTPLGMEAEPEDFHGDGGHGEIDVVWADRPLGLDGQPEAHEGIAQSAFRPVEHPALLLSQGGEPKGTGRHVASARGLVRGIDLLGALSVPAVSPRQAAGLRSPSWRDAIGAQAFRDGVARDLEPSGQFDHASTSLVRGAERGGIYVPQVAVLDKPAGAQSSIEDGLRDASGHVDRVEALPSAVRLDRVVEIRVGSASCHVFNLETIPGWYSAAGIVTHNCWPVPVGTPERGRLRIA